MKSIKTGIGIIGIVSLIVVTGCNKKDDTTPDNNNTTTGTNSPKGTLMLHLHTFIGDNEVQIYNNIETTPEGRKISLSKAQMFISNIQLLKLDGSFYSVPNTVILQMQEQETYKVGEVPAANYKGITLGVGLDSVTNSKVPSSSTDPLNNSSMWFGSSAQPEGYVFMNVEGKIDTTQAANGTINEMQPFKYLIGTKVNFKTVPMPPKNYTISPGQATFVHFYIDFSKVFNGINLSDPANLKVESAADNAGNTALKIGNNISSMFFYE